MSNFSTTTGPKFQNIESVFLVDLNYENQNIESVFLVDYNYENQNVKNNIKIQTNWLLTFWFYIWREKRSERQKSKRSTTCDILPMFTKACGGLG